MMGPSTILVNLIRFFFINHHVACSCCASMYHHNLNLSHENNPLMGHGRFSDACFGSWCCHCCCYAAAIIDYCLIDLIIVVCIWSSLERLAMLKMVCTVVAKERGNRLQYAICGVGQIYLDSDKAMSISMVDGVDS